MILSLTACGSRPSDGGVETTGTNTESTAQAQEDSVELNVTTTFAGEDGNAENYKDAIKAWSEKTGNTVADTSATSDETFKTRVITDFETGSEPDVLFFFNGADANSFIEAGKVNTSNWWLTMLSVILPQVAGNLAFSIVVLTGYMKSLPVELEEAAYMEGCNAFQIYFKVIMPLTRPSFATVAIFAFLWSYNDLFTQMFLLRRPEMRTITRLLNELTSQEGTNYGLMAAAVTLVVVPVVIVYIFLQKSIIKGMTAGAVKG